MTRTLRNAALAALTALAAIAAIVAADFTPPVSAQSDGVMLDNPGEDPNTGRIVARRLRDGRTELGWQQRTNVGWGERILPRARYLPAAPTVGRWLRTSPVEVEGVEIGRIEARLRRDGGIELAFTPTDGERFLPFENYIPSNVEVGRWRHTTEIEVSPPEDLTTPAAAGCPEPTQLFRVTETTPIARRIVREERLDTDCQVDGLPRGAVRPADRYAFTLDKPSRVSAELWSTAFAAGLFLTDANGAYYYLDGTEAEGGRRLSLSGSRAADGDGDAIIDSATGMTPASLNRVRLDAGSYWLFAVSESGSRTGDYQLVVEYERIADSEPLDQQIAERFAPVLFFEQEEAFFPVPVERMIELSTLHYTVGGQAHELAPGPGISREYGLADLISRNGQDSYLDLEDDYRAVPGDRVVYARVAEIDGADNGVLVQYWFFYLYNETGDRIWSHEGDWEGVQMWFAGLDRDALLTATVPTQIGYAAHESGWALTPDAESCAEINAPISPKVYVARNRHASYPGSGSGGNLDKSFDGGDQFQGNGAVWTLPGREVPDAEGDTEEYEIRIMPSAHQSWLTWQGKWGDKKIGSDGPQGPAFKLHFWAPPMFNGHWSVDEFTCFAG